MTHLELIAAAALLVLSCLLYVLYHQRVLRGEEERWSSWEESNSWEGSNGFDAKDLHRTLRRVRKDHLAARPKPKATASHRGLLSLARRAVARLPYFHDRAAVREHLS
jgi:hypothetical protein